MIGRLPDTIEVGKKQWKIRTDYRDILNIFCAFNDEELLIEEKVIVCLTILYIDYENMPVEIMEEAYKKAIDFFNMGIQEDKNKNHPKLMDWEQDENMIFSAINKVAGMEVRACEYMHWWTFMSFYMGITESLFSDVINIRDKKAQHKKLEKHESEFYKKNKELIDLKVRHTREELKEREELERLIYGVS